MYSKTKHYLRKALLNSNGYTEEFHPLIQMLGATFKVKQTKPQERTAQELLFEWFI